jgi:hypothetical protein
LVNRNFIEDALEKAIKKLHETLTVEEALRDEKLALDKDTKGVPGTPPIVDTIFEKISKCGIFPPDITFVGKTEAGWLIPNPNVLIEYGWALREVGHSRLIPVMNTFYGEPSAETLPFTLMIGSKHLLCRMCSDYSCVLYLQQRLMISGHRKPY